MYLPSAKRDLSFLFFIFPHDIKYQEKYIYITERKDTMLRFKKMDCWQECNFPSSKSPIGFHTLQGFSRYTREIGRRSLGMELLTSLQIQAYLRLWTLPKVTLFLNPHPLG